MNRFSKYAERGIGAFKYLLGISMLVSGFGTAFSPLTPMHGALGLIYSTRISLVIFGIIFFCCGAALLYGKIRRSRKWTGRGLFSIFCCYLFATLLQGIAYAWNPGAWAVNALMTLIVGALWLRWKLKTEYVNPKHFRDEVMALR